MDGAMLLTRGILLLRLISVRSVNMLGPFRLNV
jgi:hypothetical protein